MGATSTFSIESVHNDNLCREPAHPSLFASIDKNNPVLVQVFFAPFSTVFWEILQPVLAHQRGPGIPHVQIMYLLHGRAVHYVCLLRVNA